jgi:hypothetical protein
LKYQAARVEIPQPAKATTMTQEYTWVIMEVTRKMGEKSVMGTKKIIRFVPLM